MAAQTPHATDLRRHRGAEVRLDLAAPHPRGAPRGLPCRRSRKPIFSPIATIAVSSGTNAASPTAGCGTCARRNLAIVFLRTRRAGARRAVHARRKDHRLAARSSGAGPVESSARGPEGHLTGDDLSFEARPEQQPDVRRAGSVRDAPSSMAGVFSARPILVVLMDDVVANRAGGEPHGLPLSRRRCDFVPEGLRSALQPQLCDAFGRARRSIKNTRTARRGPPACSWAWEAAAGTGLRSMYRGVNIKPSEAVIPRPRPQTLAQLRQRFEPEIRELEPLLGRSLHTWLVH